MTDEMVMPVPIGGLAAALAKAQASFPAVTRSKTVTVTTKTGGSYKFSYAPLDAILDAVRKPLADNGLALSQLLDGQSLVTVLLHESGASLEGRTPVPSTGDVQAFGSAITYIRRYAIQALLGIAAEEDDDGNASKGQEAKPERKPREYGRAQFPQRQPSKAADERPPQSETPIPESAPSTAAEATAAEPPRPLHPAGMVQCDSISPFQYEGQTEPSQCRKEQGHDEGKPPEQVKHRTPTESWSDADVNRARAASQPRPVA